VHDLSTHIERHLQMLHEDPDYHGRRALNLYNILREMLKQPTVTSIDDIDKSWLKEVAAH
jgi:hypothetical protein